MPGGHRVQITVAYHTALLEKAAAAGIKTFVIHPSSEPITPEERHAPFGTPVEGLGMWA